MGEKTCTSDLLASDADVQTLENERQRKGFRASIDSFLTLRTTYSLLLGQTLSFLLIGTGVTSRYLATEHNFDLPQFQSFLNYLLLAIVFFPILWWRGGLRKAFANFAWVKWFILGAVDVEGNFMIVMAYQYASITTVQLLDNFTVPAVVVLSFFVLSIHYRFQHLLGATVCLAGVLTLVSHDIAQFGMGGGKNEALGDILVLAASLCYAFSNVAQEFLLKHNISMVEWLAMIGLVGTVIGGAQFLGLELHKMSNISWTGETIGLLAGYVACLFLFYVLVPVMVAHHGATLLNLSLLTCDFYSLLVGLLLFHDVQFSWVYGLAFAMSVLGLIVYTACTPPVATGQRKVVRVYLKWWRENVVGADKRATETSEPLELPPRRNSYSRPDQ